jgi:hypothetical protein
MRLYNRDLLLAYKVFNKKFFNNRLPKDMPCRFVKMKGALGQTHLDPQTWRPAYIAIASKLSGSHRVVWGTLIHEMVHVANPTKRGHGPWFEKTMIDLAKRHAFRGLW